MAITVADVLNMHAFVPNPDLVSPYPVGIWKAQRTQVTDASGGLVRWTVTPPTDLARAYRYLWNLEDYSFLTSVSSNDIWLYLEVYTGETISRAGGAEVMRFARSEVCYGGAATGRLLACTTTHEPMRFIHQPGGGNLNTYIMEAANFNAQVYTMTFWGYFWNSEARRLASGPLRPTYT